MNFKRIIFVLISALLCLSSYANIIVVGGLTHEEIASPNQSYTGVISLENPETREVEVKIYQRDYFFVADGEVYYGDPGTRARRSSSRPRC